MSTHGLFAADRATVIFLAALVIPLVAMIVAGITVYSIRSQNCADLGGTYMTGICFVREAIIFGNVSS